MYLFGLLYSCVNHRYADILDKNRCNVVMRKVRFAPVTLVCTALTPVILLYSVFFVSQRDYYISAFSGVLPENLSYSSYARDGFFEICAVAVINTCMLVAASLFCRRNNRADDTQRMPVILKIYGAQELGDAGIVSVNRLAEESSKPEIRTAAENHLHGFVDGNRSYSIFSFSVPHFKAEKVLDGYR